jgi:lipopolysaccharide/colanic/teichoic acid biosynthesis glycosyltransferase
MSISLKIQPPTAEMAEKGVLVEATAAGEIRPDAGLELSPYFARKALATRMLGGLLLAIAFPLILLLVAMVRCTTAGPGLFRQQRVGKGGKEFTMYKIRTMYQDAEATSGPVWCQPADSRITCCGRLLRFLHLDELPQLINIVRGEMDLIGPRPERFEFVAQLVDKIPHYAQRLAVLPGITGLAQINLPPDETTDCVRRKLVLDLEYIAITSWGVDFRILVCTALRMMGIRHGHAVRLMRLEYLLSEDHSMFNRKLQSDAARSVEQKYLFSREQFMDDAIIADEVCKIDDDLPVHADCQRVRSDTPADEKLDIPLTASSSEVARMHPR